jgi:cell division protein FtsI (penicillin-binding protein 3)
LTPRYAIKRLSLIYWCFLLSALVIIGHLYRIQVIRHQRYLSEAERQHKQKIVLPPKRGDIFDRNGNPLALSAEGLDVYAVPERIKNKKQVAHSLASQLNLNENQLLDRISGKRPFVMIQQKVNPLALSELQEMNLEGVGFIPSSKRYYPRHSLAAQVIGYVGVDEVGLTGVEFSHDSHLCGKPGWLVVQRDARGKPYNTLEYPLRRQTNGYHLRLTLDAEFQEIVEEALRRSVEKSGARNGCVVALDPHTGKILALANCPSIDLNAERNFRKGDFFNLATNLPFEPGSTFKTFTASALLAGGHISLNDSIFCENGVYTLRNRIIRDVHPYGNLTVKEVISKSSNIGMSKLIRKIGDKELYRTLRAFGFGAYTGENFGGEDRGLLPAPARWDRTTKTSLAIGYGVLVTPLQMAMAYASLANGGILYEPGLVAEIYDESGNLHYSFKPRKIRRVLPEKVAREITRALIAVVDSGTGTAASVPGFKVAGKTGTSMKADPESGYGGNGYISSFGGFFPAINPQIVILITINEPSYSSRWGGSCAAPVFGEIIRNTLLSTSNVINRRLLGLPYSTVKTAALNTLQTPGRMNPVTLQRSAARTSSSSERIIMPQLTGLSMRKALTILTELGLKARVEGGLKVRIQSPKPGIELPRGALCRLIGISSSQEASSYSMVTQSARELNNSRHLQQIDWEEK